MCKWPPVAAVWTASAVLGFDRLCPAGSREQDTEHTVQRQIALAAEAIDPVQ
jgi:hypothetical protein